MAKSRAQRKAEQRAREAENQKRESSGSDVSHAQHDTQIPISGDIAEIEAVEAGIAAGASEADLETPDANKKTPRSERRAEAAKRKEAERRKVADQKRQEKETLARRQKKAAAEQKRGGVIGFLASCWAELKKVQWPNRETLVQATAVTIIFVAVAATYIGLLDVTFNYLIKKIL